MDLYRDACLWEDQLWGIANLSEEQAEPRIQLKHLPHASLLPPASLTFWQLFLAAVFSVNHWQENPFLGLCLLTQTCLTQT